MTRFLVNQNNFENDFNQIFNSFFNQSQFQSCCSDFESKGKFSPKVNIAEKDDSISLTFELPGMDKANIKVLVKDNILTVSGDRKVESEVKTDGYVRTEISSGSFNRSFNLPDTVKQDSVNADYKNGLLFIKLDKKEEMKPKEIEIQVS